ncbi:MAG TPA: hypothetical protein PK358_14815 [Spirochaetota bacterium]|nr:hypothetical protein [Spirochaetota bacterium]HPJ36109.1 hypothetical protein [Spirochaetota bacterium]
MKNRTEISLSSMAELFGKLFRVFPGPFLVTALRRTDPKFREKLLLTVSMSNECGG